jgi:periplasmic protein TonB
MAVPRSTLAVAGTVAVHVLLATGIDIATVVGRGPARGPAPELALVDLDLGPPPPPPPPIVEPEVAPPTEAPPTTPPPPTTRRATPQRVATRAPTTTAEPPPSEPPSQAPVANPGGAPTVVLPDVAPAARGIAVGNGTPTTRRTGRGGEGTGTGSGSGSGADSGPPPPKVVSVASIKKAAVPRGDYDYFDAKKQYPAQARQLGVGGVIRVQLTIDDQGKVTRARLIGKGLGHGLDELALTRARSLTFDPALDTDNRPVASVLTWTFRFEVPS